MPPPRRPAARASPTAFAIDFSRFLAMIRASFSFPVWRNRCLGPNLCRERLVLAPLCGLSLHLTPCRQVDLIRLSWLERLVYTRGSLERIVTLPIMSSRLGFDARGQTRTCGDTDAWLLNARGGTNMFSRIQRLGALARCFYGSILLLS